MTAVLAADSVGKRFGERRVLTCASLRAVPGELRALMGRNGIGKSTLIKIAAGWLRPDSGMVFLDGDACPRTSRSALARRGVFYLPDHDLFSDAFTLRAQLDMLRARFDGRPVGEAVERMGIERCLDLRPATLSGGERRRAELAAILVRAPRVLLADEPYRGVAPLDAERLTQAFRELSSLGMAVVVTGHEVPTLLAAADHITWCTAGTTVELGPPDAAAAHDQFRREYLGGSLLA